MAQNIRWAGWPLALLVALVSLSIGLGSAQAAPKDTGNKALERGYERAKKSLVQQEQHLRRLGEFADRVAAAVAKAKAKGKDTAAVEQALASFRDKLAAARADWQTASAALASHNGFDDQGKVTNAEAARATLKTARDAMLRARQTVAGSAKQLREALKAFRKANKGADVPEVPATPPAPAP